MSFEVNYIEFKWYFRGVLFLLFVDKIGGGE